MLKKIFLIITLLLLCSSISFAGSRFFIEGGIGGRYINGSINYGTYNSDNNSEFELSREPLNEAPLDNSVTASRTLGWKSKLLGNYNATIGFRISEKFVTTVSAQYFTKKAGFAYIPSTSYPNINTQIGEDIERNSLNSSVETSWFSQINLRVIQNVYLNKSLYFVAGFEYTFLKMDFPNSSNSGLIRNRVEPTYKDNALGAIVGFGYELPLSSKMSIMTTGIYSFTSYQGDELYYKNLDFDIGGFELGYTLRYYLK